MYKLKLYLYDFYKSNGRMPSVDLISEKLQLTKDEITEQYRKLVKAGYIQKIGEGEYRFFDTELNEMLNEKVKKAGRRKKKKVKIEETKKTFGLSNMAVRIVMGIIAVVAMVVSSYYSAIWLSNFLPLFVA